MENKPDERFAAIQLWSNDPYIFEELIRELVILTKMGMETLVFMVKDGADMAFPKGIRRASRESGLADDLIKGIESCIDSNTIFLVCKKCFMERTSGDENDLGRPFMGATPEAYNNFIEEVLVSDVFLTVQGVTEKRTNELIDRRIKKALQA